MISYLLRELIIGFGAGMRSIKAYLLRGVLNVWTKLRQATQVARGATRVMSKATKNISQIGKTPAQKSDFVETKRLFIAKTFIFRMVFLLILVIAAAYFLIYPLVMRYFFTAHMDTHNSRIPTYNGKVVVYYDSKKTVPYYQGYLKDGQLQGEGKQYDPDGILSYEGEFVDGKRSGYGEEYENGELIYRGQFENGDYSGAGEEFKHGLLVCSGTYENGKLNGSDCYLYYPNGRASYRGAFAGGEQTGEGIAYAESGIQTYAGSFLRGKWQGEGTAYDENGEPCYIGEFKNNCYEGDGVLYMDDGFQLEGTFSQGVQNGDVRISRDGIVYYEGTAVNCEPNGQGTIYNELGNVLYSGTMRGGVIDGRMLLGRSQEAVTEMLGDVRLTAEKREDGIMLCSEELGLNVCFGYSLDDGTTSDAYDVLFYRASEANAALQRFLWGFSDDIDAWRAEMWPKEEDTESGTAVPQFAAETLSSQSLLCVIYRDSYADCTLWSDSGGICGIQWTVSGGETVIQKTEDSSAH